MTDTEVGGLGEHVLGQFVQTFGDATAVVLDCRKWVAYVVGPELRIKHFLVGKTESRELDDYITRFTRLDPLGPHECLASGRQVATLGKLLRPELEAHRAYRDGFLAPHGIVDAMEIYFRSEAELTVGFSMLRHGGEPPFGAAEYERALALKSLGDLAVSQALPKRKMSRESLAERFPILTSREITLIQLVAAGLNNKQLCRELGISLPTAKTHLLSIFRKMEVGSRTALAAKVLA